MELDLHVSVRESASSEFEREMERRFGMIPADSVTTYPEDAATLPALEDEAEVDFLYVVATKRMAAPDIQARMAALQHFLLEEQRRGSVATTEFEPDDMEALRLLGLSLVRAYAQHGPPVFLLITATGAPFQEEPEEDLSKAPFASAARGPQSLARFSVHTTDVVSRFDMYHALLRPEQVPLPLNDLWRRMLYCHYITLSLRMDRLSAGSAPPRSDEAKLIQEELLPAWEKWFSDQVTDPVLGQHEQHLLQLALATDRGASTVQAMLSQFPSTRHVALVKEGFTCRQCFLTSKSVRVAYYHGFLAS